MYIGSPFEECGTYSKNIKLVALTL